MRRFLVFEPDAGTRRVIGQLLTERLASFALLYADVSLARRAWSNGLHARMFDGAIVNVDSEEGLDFAQYAKASRASALVVFISTDVDGVCGAATAARAPVVARERLASELVRAVGFEGTLPAGLAGKPR